MPRLYVPQETVPSERCVAAVPETVQRLVAAGFEVEIQAGAGLGAGFTDASFQAAGGRIVPAGSAGATALRQADVVFKVLEPLVTEVDQIRPGALLFAHLDPFRNLPLVRRLAERRISTFAMELAPRLPPARAMEAHASPASISGEKAVLIGATRSGKLPAGVPSDTSRTYARGLSSLLMLCFDGKQVRIDLDDEAVAGALLTHAGEIRNRAIAALLTDTAIRA